VAAGQDSPPITLFGNGRSDPQHLPGIARDQFVRGDQREALDLGLRYQHVVEGVLVERRQGEGCDGVFARYGELVPAVVDEPAPQPPRLDTEVGAPEPALDRDLPQARRAEPEL
jgi:hypothetical protein